MTRVHVWDDRYIRSWQGEEVDIPPAYPIVDWTTALKFVYRTDAHFCPARIDGVDEHHPRLNLELAQPYKDKVVFDVIVVDVDGPGHKCSDEWWAEQNDKIRLTPWDGGIRYRTRGGYRIVWELPYSMGIDDYLRHHAALRNALKNIGVPVDEAPVLLTWNVSYRLPFVTRDGKMQNHEFIDSENAVLPTGLLELSVRPDGRLTLGAELAKVSIPVDLSEAAGAGNRNSYLHKVCSSLRNLSWLDEELATEFLNVVNEFKCSPPLTPREASREIPGIVKSVFRSYKPMEDTDLEDEEIPRTEIDLRNGELHKSVEEVIEVLKDSPNLYVRSGKLVRIINKHIDLLPKDALSTLMSRQAAFFKYVPVKDGMKRVASNPPEDLRNCVFAEGTYPGIRELEQVLTCPTMRPDGELLTHPGYDEETKTYLNPDFIVSLPDYVSKEEAAAALARLKAPFRQFPFVSAAHYSGLIAAIMTPILRLAIQGPTPLFIFDSPTPGTGKGLLADAVSLISLGRKADVMSMTDDTELEKRITALLGASTQVVLIDNIKNGTALGSPHLDAVLTSNVWMGRTLSKSEMVRYRNMATWVATGCQIRIEGDLKRRSIRCYIDAKMENPENRKFDIEDLGQYLIDNRADLVRDILLIARGRHQAGKVPASTYGSFGAWSYWVREALLWLGEADPLLTQEALKANSPVNTWGRVLECLMGIFQSKENAAILSDLFYVKDVWDAAIEQLKRRNAPQQFYDGLQAAIGELMRDGTIKDIQRILVSWTDRVVGGLRLVAGESDLKGVPYRIERVEPVLDVSGGKNGAYSA